jgi:hypothetical protein
MGFSPVTGGGTITAHTHTNSSSDGGSLNQNSLILSAPLLPLVMS